MNIVRANIDPSRAPEAREIYTNKAHFTHPSRDVFMTPTDPAARLGAAPTRDIIRRDSFYPNE